MTIVLLLALFILAVVMPKSRLLFWIMAAYMWLLFSLNTGAPDTGTYKWIYESAIQGAFEPLFTAIMNACSMLGMSYTGFRMVVATLLICFLNLAFNKVGPYKTLAMAIYMISPFPWQVSGMRAALACAILMYAMTFLFDKKEGDTYKFCIFLLLATLVHYSSILFAVMLFAGKQTSRRRTLAFLTIAVVGIIVVQNTDFLLETVSQFTSREKILTWLSGGIYKDGYPSLKGFAAELIILAGNIFLTQVSKNTIERNDLKGESTRIAEAICNLNLATILFIPLLRLNDTYMRLLLVMHGVNAILYAMTALIVQEEPEVYDRQRFLSTPQCARISLYSLSVPFWTYVIAVYQNLPYFGTTESVLEFLGKYSMFP